MLQVLHVIMPFCSFLACSIYWMKPSSILQMMKKIGTHNGVFHCDEALACAILRSLPEFDKAEVVRTRDQKLLDTCDIVVDVGGVFDHEMKR